MSARTIDLQSTVSKVVGEAVCDVQSSVYVKIEACLVYVH